MNGTDSISLKQITDKQWLYPSQHFNKFILNYLIFVLYVWVVCGLQSLVPQDLTGGCHDSIIRGNEEKVWFKNYNKKNQFYISPWTSTLEQGSNASMPPPACNLGYPYITLETCQCECVLPKVTIPL